MYLRVLLIIGSLLLCRSAVAQLYDNDGKPVDVNGGSISDGTNKYSWGRDSVRTRKTDVPEGFFQWSLDERLGERIEQQNDTVMAGFYRANQTDGPTGRYIHTGNLAAPRQSLVFFDRPMCTDAYVFMQGYDYLRPSLASFRFWNTKSPITNLSYHSVGSSQNGEDHLRATFASNINKRAGIGFLIDYAYGRGYYPNQGNSLLDGSLYGYYLGDKYQMHAWTSLDHFKTTENGGVEDDIYIRNPESFDRDFTSSEIPSMISSNWNRNDARTYYLTHRYNFGYYRDIEQPDTLDVDSLLANDSTYVVPQEFIPVASIIHTFQLRKLRHTHYGKREDENYYSENLYGILGGTRDRQDNMNVRNTLGVSLREGFRPWVKAGLTAFVTHDYNVYDVPALNGSGDNAHPQMRYKENDISVGGSLTRTGGRALHFNVTGEAVVAGENIGDFSVDGNAQLNVRLFGDTCRLKVRAYIKNKAPGFYWRHWHSQHAWWDRSLSKEFRSRIEGALTVERSKTRLSVGVENVTNYTYLATRLTPLTSAETTAEGASEATAAGNVPQASVQSGFSRAYSVGQKSGAIQVMTATLNQNFKLGSLHWDNEVTWQHSTDEELLPLPTVVVFTNLYLHFKIARIMRVDIGANMRYWTEFYANDYAPALNQFTVQDSEWRLKVGNHPIVDVYVNAQLKRLRFYVSANHVNAGSHPGFYAPHYPVNPMNIQFGLSWNFVN